MRGEEEDAAVISGEKGLVRAAEWERLGKKEFGVEVKNGNEVGETKWVLGAIEGGVPQYSRLPKVQALLELMSDAGAFHVGLIDKATREWLGRRQLVLD